MPNRLANASSPYLRQHASNPVDWQPWDTAALAQARETDTPILLSIGYSACHWCHVMAHECFAKPDIAAEMNRAFVSIKLDREERPDIDHAYQLAHQALTGRGGGWPLTAFLDPQDLSPFFIGTYFPPTPRHGLPGFPEVLAQVRDYFDTHRSELREHAQALDDWLRQANAASEARPIDARAVQREALQRIRGRTDPRWGGTTGAPKFPRATELEWLLDQRGEQPDASEMAERTLASMARRGLQDHLGGGFFRYCVDADWTIPHFEKMLYDNAQLLPVYARAAAEHGADEALRGLAHEAARGVVDWLEHDMTAPNGAFYSSLDADSAGEEGKFYLWTREEVYAVLAQTAGRVAERAFGLDQPPNFEGRAWHLLRAVPLDDIARELGVPPSEVQAEVADARRALRAARERRPHPSRDDKLLVAWNALTISGLARSARLLDEVRCAQLAQRALAALRESAWIEDALYANLTSPEDRIPGFLDDHAFLLDALLEVLQLDFDLADLAWASALADALLARFQDPETGAFWFSTAEHRTPLARAREFTDASLPNGNGVAIRALLRVGHLLGRTDYLDAAGRALAAAGAAIAQLPDACPTLLRALREFDHPRAQIVIRCTVEHKAAWRAALRDAVHAMGHVPGDGLVDAFIIPAAAEPLPGVLASRTAKDDVGTAWICEGTSCRAPITSPRDLVDAWNDG